MAVPATRRERTYECCVGAFQGKFPPAPAHDNYACRLDAINHLLLTNNCRLYTRIGPNRIEQILHLI